jgi:hypothetical protein
VKQESHCRQWHARPTVRVFSIALLLFALAISSAQAWHGSTTPNSDQELPAANYWIWWRAVVLHQHGGNGVDTWEAYGDHGGSVPSSGTFDQLFVQVWQVMRAPCGSWSVMHYAEQYAYGTTVNSDYAGYEYEPSGSCIPKRRAQMTGKWWDGGSYWEKQITAGD